MKKYYWSILALSGLFFSISQGVLFCAESAVEQAKAERNADERILTPDDDFVSEEFYSSEASGNKVSGLVEVSGYKYPVYLFAPRGYSNDKKYPLVLFAPSETMKAEEQIEYLTALAERKGVFVLSPYVLWPKAGDTPYQLDQWLITIKKDIMERFPIAKNRVYLLGKGSGGHYAAYMGTNYPEEFSGIILLEEAWDGQFSQLIRPQSSRSKQKSFYVALKAGGDALARNQKWLEKYQKLGYSLQLNEYQGDEAITNIDFKKSAFDWVEETGKSARAQEAKGGKTWKEKILKGINDFFKV